ncbi:MAG: PPC domain-containing protein [Planctomycetes bacterium]|nr:PPC domain-containing protein [Planctomycetota bacterium]
MQVVVCVVLTLPSVALAQAFVEGVSPASVCRGKTTRLTLLGSNLDGALELWSTLSSELIEAKLVGESTAERAVFDVEVAATADLGLFGLRLGTIDGLSNMHIFVVDDLCPQLEAAIDDDKKDLDVDAEPERISLPAAVSGIYRQDDHDSFAFEVGSNERVSFEVIGSRLGKDFDSLAVIRDASGKQLTAHDNDVGLFYDCKFEYTFESAGTYTIEVRDARFKGSPFTTYLLRAGRYPAARVALPSSVEPGKTSRLRFPQAPKALASFQLVPDFKPGRFFFAYRRPGDDASTWLPLLASELPNSVEQEPNNSAAAASPAVAPGHLHGVLAEGRDEDWFRFDAESGQRFRVGVESKSLGSPADIVVAIHDAEGKQVARGDDTGLDEARFEFTAPSAGPYHLAVSDLIHRGGPAFVYRVEVHPVVPDFDLEAGAARLAIPQGTRQPLPLRLERRGFDEEIELVLVGAPEGMTLQDAAIPEGESRMDTAIRVDSTVEAGVYAVEVVGRGRQGDLVREHVARTHPLVDRIPSGRGPHGEPFVHREDQRRLPPSLTHRIAVQVTPPSPFDFELSTSVVHIGRFLEKSYEISVTRVGGYDGPVEFKARGGTLDKDGMGRYAVRTETPTAVAGVSEVTAWLRSTVICVQKPVNHRVAVTGEVVLDGRRIFLTRTFEMYMRPAFEPTADPPRVELRPGESTQVRVLANRIEPHREPITISLSGVSGLQLPESVIVPEGEGSVMVEISASENLDPGNYTVALSGSGRVGKFEETWGPKTLEVVVPVAEKSGG